MSLRVSNPNESPPGYWYFPVEGKTIGPFPARVELSNAVRKYYSSNGLLVPADLETQIDEFTCRRIHPSLCEDSQAHTKILTRSVENKQQRMPFNAVVQGTLTIGEWFVAGRILGKLQLVPKEHANVRAITCSGCPHNVPVGSCPACVKGRMAKAVERVVGNDHTDHDDKLGACNLCGCALKAKVWLPVDLLRKHMTEEHLKQFPSFCWLASEVDQKATGA